MGDNCCFQYAVTDALNHMNISNHPESVKNITPFINKYDWNDIKFPCDSCSWKKFEKNNKYIALNILQIPYDEKNIYHAYKSKHNNERKNQIVLVMITDGDGNWHYTALKSIQDENGNLKPTKRLSRLFKGITSNHKGDYYCLNCLHSFRTKTVLDNHEKLCNDNEYTYSNASEKK